MLQAAPIDKVDRGRFFLFTPWTIVDVKTTSRARFPLGTGGVLGDNAPLRPKETFDVASA